jgi:hypothetical protein
MYSFRVSSFTKTMAFVCFGAAGAFLVSSFMLFGTLLLGHVRPVWMEAFKPGYTLFGFAAGGAVGLLIQRRASKRND